MLQTLPAVRPGWHSKNYIVSRYLYVHHSGQLDVTCSVGVLMRSLLDSDFVLLAMQHL